MFLPSMIHQALAGRGPAKIALIGAGAFGAGIVGQSSVPLLCAPQDTEFR